MPRKVVIKHLWESIFIGVVTSMIVMAFFMPYYAIHHQLSTDIKEVLLAFNPTQKSVNEIIQENADVRIILFEDIRDTSGTIFSPSLLFSNGNFQETTMVYSSFDYFMKNQVSIGDVVEILGVEGYYGGFYSSEHPYGDDFVVVISDKVADLQFSGEIREWNMDEGYKSPILPRAFRGTRLLNFLIFSGILYLVYGIVSILLDNSYDLLKENALRLAIVMVTIIACVTIYGTIINPQRFSTIFWACVLAIGANIMMIPPLFLFWVGKKIYNRV